MGKGDTTLIRQLVPIRWMFDLYIDPQTGHVEPNSRLPCTKPFFGDAVISFKRGNVTTNLEDSNTLKIHFSSVCPMGNLVFRTVKLTMNDFIARLEKMVECEFDFIHLKIEFDKKVSIEHDSSWDEYYYPKCRECAHETKECRYLRDLAPAGHTIMSAVQFDLGQVREALAVYHGIKNAETAIKGGNFMRKGSFGKLFGGIEMGMSHDSRIKSTLTGIVVQNPETGKWYAFDPATRTRKDMMNLKFGDFPIVLLPVKALNVGDLIKRDGKYFYVQSLNADNTFTGVNAMDGAIQTFLLEESLIPGFKFYTKVVAFDAKTLMDPNSKQNMGGNVLGAMLMMQMAKGDKAEFSLDDINDDSFNGLGCFMPLLLASKDGNLGLTNADGSPNIMMMMMMFSDDSEGGMNEFMKMTLLSNLLGGNNAANPLGDIMNGLGMATPAAVAPTGNFVCTKCGKQYDDPAVHFCTECGGSVAVAGVQCKKCGATLKAGAKFCHCCGAKVGPEVCPKCGKEVDEDAKFCPHCGQSLKERTIDVLVSAPEQPEEPTQEV